MKGKETMTLMKQDQFWMLLCPDVSTRLLNQLNQQDFLGQPASLERPYWLTCIDQYNTSIN